MQSLEKLVFSYHTAKIKFSLPPVVVFLAAHLYPSYARARRNNTSFSLRFFPRVQACATLQFASNIESHFSLGAPTMEWTTPQHEEIDLNCEISSYANAEL